MELLHESSFIELLPCDHPPRGGVPRGEEACLGEDGLKEACLEEACLEKDGLKEACLEKAVSRGSVRGEWGAGGF